MYRNKSVYWKILNRRWAYQIVKERYDLIVFFLLFFIENYKMGKSCINLLK